MGYRIKEKREVLGMTQEQLAEKAGISRITIALVESGKQADMKVGNLKKLASALDCSISELIS